MTGTLCLLIEGREMKHFLSLFFCMLFILLPVYIVNGQSLQIDDQEMIFAFGEVFDWYDQALELQKKASDEDSSFLMDKVLNALYDARIFVMLSLDEENLLNEDKGDIEHQEQKCFSSNEYLLCQTPYVSLMQSYVQSDIYWRTDYLSIITYYYDDLGRYAGYQRIDAARRDDGQVLFYLNIHDPINVMTSRCAVWQDTNDEIRTIYFGSLGAVLDVNLDVDAWQSGEDFEWDELLLYSRFQ